MGLKPGWKILEEAASDLLDPRLEELHYEERARRIRVLQENVNVRQKEIIPNEEHDRVVDTVTSAVTKIVGVWPKDVCEFVKNHGGDEAIDRFISNNPGWTRHQCPCGCGANMVVEKAVFEMAEKAHEELSGVVDLLFSAFMGGVHHSDIKPN